VLAVAGVLVLAGWATGWFADFGSSAIDTVGMAPVQGRDLMRANVGVAGFPDVAPISAPATARLKIPEPQITTLAPSSSDGTAAGAVAAPEPETVAQSAAESATPKPSIQSARAEPTDMVRTEPVFELASAPLAGRRAKSAADAAPVADVAMTGTAHMDARSTLKLQAAPVQMAAVSPFDMVPDVRSQRGAASDECLGVDACVDEYLFALYQRAPKLDTIKVPERIKVTVKKKGKLHTVTKIVTRLVDQDFAWKDPKAADRVGMSLMDYVIGGMDRGFKLKLYQAMRVMDAAGMQPGITSAFRDDYRQAIATGKKAASDSSYHGGSRRGGYGYGMAADVVSVKGETRMERYRSTEEMWKWIDAHEKELGIGRPYLNRDPPHVGPTDGKEFADKRGLTKVASLQKTAGGWPYASVLALRRTQAAKTPEIARHEKPATQVMTTRPAQNGPAKHAQAKVQTVAASRILRKQAKPIVKRDLPAAQIRGGRAKERQAATPRRAGAGV
jgi:hypothetical protein